MDVSVQGPTCATDKSCCGGDQAKAVAAEPSCALTPAEMPERTARWRRLFADHLDHEVETTQATFRFANAPGLMSELQELIKLEEICCANVSWRVSEQEHETLLTLIADEGSIRPLVAGFLPVIADRSGGQS